MSAPKLDIKFGRRTRQLAKYDASFPHLIFAQLVAVGFQPNEAAWVAFKSFSKTSTNEELEAKAKTIMERDKTKILIKHFRDEISTLSVEQAEAEAALLDAEATANEIYRIAKGLPDGKERADMLMKYADLKGFRKAGGDTKSENTAVGFVIPVQCNDCPCFMFAMDHGTPADQKAKFSSKV